MKLTGKVALITGAGSGIGAATARYMAQAGAKIALAGIPAEGLESVAQSIQQTGQEAIALPTDVTQAAQIQSALAKTIETWGQLDILVANAGIQLHNEDVNLHELPEAVWDKTHDVNYKGVYLTLKHGLAQFVAQKSGGAVIIVASVTAFSGASPNVAYLTGKHGLLGLNRYVAVHYAKHGIRCNAVCPGALEKTPNHDVHPDPEGREARLNQRIPLGRLGRPEDIAPTISFLASDESAYTTGAYFLVDGGLTAG